MGERMFPIQPYSRGVVREDKNKNKGPHPMRVPWSVADQAYSVYAARYGESQTLEHLAERGGFGAEEMDAFLPDWREKSDALAQARARVKVLEGRRIPYFDARGADRLAREVEALVKRGVIDARSPAGDALLDYQEGRALAGEVAGG